MSHEFEIENLVDKKMTKAEFWGKLKSSECSAILALGNFGMEDVIFKQLCIDLEEMRSNFFTMLIFAIDREHHDKFEDTKDQFKRVFQKLLKYAEVTYEGNKEKKTND